MKVVPSLAVLLLTLGGVFISVGNSAMAEPVIQAKKLTPEAEFAETKKKAEAGDADAQFLLGLLYYVGDGVTKDDAKAADWFRKAAAQGHAGAQNYVPAEAVKGLQKAATQGDAEAQFNLGRRYSLGKDVAKDYAKAFEWFQKAAKQGHPNGEFFLGSAYILGQGVQKDSAKAFEWFQKAAAQGVVGAQFSLAWMYDNGDGVPKDTAKAVDLYEKSANQGFFVAHVNLGTMYLFGNGVPKDAAKAVEWWQLAAAQGYADAQFRLGVTYYRGVDLPRDIIRAYAWTNLAASQGADSSKDLLGLIESEISLEQRAEGQRLASNWKKGDAFKNIRNIPDAQTQPNKSTENSVAVRWQPVKDFSRVFIDTSSIKKADGLIYVWQKTSSTATQENDYKLLRLVINCSNDTFGVITGITIDPSGKRISTYDIDPSQVKLGSSQPDTLGDALIRASCSTSASAAPSGGSANSTGSGFMVGDNYLLTNNHVVNGCTNLKIRDDSKLAHDVTVVATDAKSDLALLKTNKPVSLPAATFRANGSVESGESVVALGYPLAGVLASEVNVSFGYVSATAGLADDTSKLQISAPVQPGNSGGPLLDQSGNLIGVVVSKLDAMKVVKAIGDVPQNINFAVKGEVAQVFLKSHKVKFKTAATTKKLENTDIASRGRAFTVLVECLK